MSATAEFMVPHRALRRYILANEKIVIATHRHWTKLWEPILTTAGALVLAITILVNVNPYVRDGMAWVWLPFLVLGARLLYKWLEWRAEWFIVTDRRLLLLTGFVVHRVSMMPSGKVTDLRYERTPMGQVLGYGTFIFESAGQDQALDRVAWMPRPDSRYRLIIATLFQPDAVDAETSAQAGPTNSPQAAPAEDATPPPPALMPRIGRRSNPPTQRIEIPGDGDDDTQDDTQGALQGSAVQDDVGPGIIPERTWPSATARAAQSRVADAAAASGAAGAGGEHVPGGPTSGPDPAEKRPDPFIEGGKDPRMR